MASQPGRYEQPRGPPIRSSCSEVGALPGPAKDAKDVDIFGILGVGARDEEGSNF